MWLTKASRTSRAGTTLIELVVAISLMVVIMGAVLPIIGSLRHSWDSAQNNTDAVQNGRVLIDHLNLNLTQARRITDVSTSGQTLGYIEFEDTDGNIQRYDVNGDGNVEFGLVGSQADLAGPVSQFLFTCYDGNDFDTPITDANAVRFIQVQATVTNAAARGQDKAVSTSVYLQVNGNNAGEFGMGTPFEYNTSNGKEPALAGIDSTHYLCAYQGSGDDGWATVLTVNPSTWAITQGTPFEFDTQQGKTPALTQIDSTHYLCAYDGCGTGGSVPEGWATILTVDTDTWTVTTEPYLEFDPDQGKTPALARIDDSHYLCAYSGVDDDGWAVVLTVGDGLVGHWKLDESSGTTAADSSGNSYDGTLTYMSGNEWCDGVVKGALDFDGYNDYINVASLSAPRDKTFACWIYIDSLSENYHTLIEFSNDAPWFGLARYGGSWYLLEWDRSCWGNTSLSTGQWYHVAYTSDSTTNRSRVYINGVEDTWSTPNANTETGSGMGIAYHSGDDHFNGKMDDVRVYSRALSADEVASLANTLRYEDFSEAKASTDATSLTITPPAATSSGDLLVAAVATDGDTAGSLAPPGGQGWTQIDLNDNGNEATLGAWWKTAGASEPSHQFTWSGAQQAYAWMMRFTGQDPTDPIDVFNTGNSTGSSPTSPSVTTTVDDALILRLGAFDGDDITVDSPGLSGHTAITMDTNAGSGLVSFEEFTEAKQPSNSSTSITLDTPAGTSTGNLLIAVVVTDKDTDVGMDPPAGQGWAEIHRGDESNEVSMGVWWKLAGASEPGTHTFTWDSWNGQQAYGWMMRFTGHDSSSPIHQFSTNAGYSSSPNCSSVTTTVDNCLILRIGAFDDGDINQDVSGLQSHTTITMDESSSGHGECSGGAGYQQQATPGTSEFTDFNLTHSEEFVTLTVAIAPATGGSGTGSVSGGAGYVKQGTAGSSGTSSFSLTASEQTRALTLAIAPAAQSEAGATTITKGTPYEFDSGKGKEPALIQIDSTHYLCAYKGDGDDGWAVVLTVNTSNWTITKGTAFEFDSGKGKRPALAQIDSTHYLCAYTGDGDHGWTVVLTVNPSTWNISKGTAFEFDTVKGKEPALVAMDSRNFLCAYAGDGDDGFSEVLTVDTDTWTVSQGDPFEFDTDKGKTPALVQIDADHYLCTYAGQGDDGWSVVLMPTTTGLQP